ncbi:MAG: hypothetical protein NTX17_03790 [Candidatus Eisenbacteria bacterium]|nr:hypothetical protein [Candidatus Eisenbacteria bacterium]
MGENKAHKAVVHRIIHQYGGKCDPEKGADVKIPFIGTVEAETDKIVSVALTQLRGYRGPVYVAGTNAVEKTFEVKTGTTIGVTDNKGNIIKSSTRKRRCP